MLKESALNTTIALASLFAYASAAIHKYDGTIAKNMSDPFGNLLLGDMTFAIEVVQTGSQVTYEYTFAGAFGKVPTSGETATISLCHSTAADAYDCFWMKTSYETGDG